MVREVKEVREVREREIKEISEIKEKEARKTCRVVGEAERGGRRGIRVEWGVLL